MLLTFPAIVELRRVLPEAAVTYFVAPGIGSIVERCPAVDEVVEIGFPSPMAWECPPEWPTVLSSSAGAMRGRFDIGLVPRPSDPWSGALLQTAGIPMRVGFAHPQTAPHLTHYVHEPGGHHTELTRSLINAMLAALGIEPLPPLGRGDPALRLRRRDHDEAAVALSGLPSEVGPSPIVVHPGTGWPVKNWPPAQWGKVAKAIGERMRATPLITGGPTEVTLAADVVRESGTCAVSVAGRLSLGGFAALLARARLVLASDSGPLHLAAMLGTPVVGLYGPWPAEEAGPWSAAALQRTIDLRLPCSPCRRLDGPPCGAERSAPCVERIDPQVVIRAAKDLIGAG